MRRDAETTDGFEPPGHTGHADDGIFDLDHDAERADLPLAWDQLEEGQQDPAPRRRSMLVAAALAPWLVVALLLVGRSGAGGGSAAGPNLPTEPTAADADASPPRPADTDGTAPAPDAAPAPEAAAAPERAPGTVEGSDAMDVRVLTSGARQRVTTADAAAIAIAIARDWLTTVGPDLAVDVGRAGGERYVEHLAVDAVDLPLPGFAVVSLIVTVLDVEDDTYTAASVRRVAVPIALDGDGARPAGTPWWLPSPALATTPPERTAVDDPDLLLAAISALEGAGYREVEVTGLASTSGWPWIVTATARAPGEPATAASEVWLREYRGGFTVAGWLPPQDAVSAPPTTSPPAASPPPTPPPGDATAATPDQEP